MSDHRARLPKRSRQYGVGKEIGGAIYLHRSYETELGTVIEEAKTRLTAEFVYTVVKYRRETGVVSFIHSSDFDSNPEPTIGAVWVIFPDGRSRFLPQPEEPFIYHHKWLFVRDDYPGFDVEASKLRSVAWVKLEGIDRSRIGRRSFWRQSVLPRLEGADPEPGEEDGEA